jgi:predicted histidine transporter YuiF (NhaC family)
MMFNVDIVTKGKFRMLVIGVILSLFYDLIWFYIKHGEYAADEGRNDGSAEVSVRKFSLLMSYASFLFRFFVIIVLWKDSMDFGRIIRNRVELPSKANQVQEFGKSISNGGKIKNLYLRRHI